ncbi:substrate-binding domain-containing protein [Paenibacillus sp. N4]|uniref:substrate-binding domain-containing protein n=1 Tax=Paenibacillus vietnamensis TaxID=2590547 RepID=UPI001CD0C668|nr:substrate-binding domain-containing protein [Paenibacillus vietnamensis]MCA0753787.1 substrate-binding domain-containing protein [Paenibacillus vietnamensis]
MRNMKWNIAVFLLLFLFAGLLASFFLSSLRIRGLLQPEAADDKAQTSAFRITLIAQELDNPYWRAIEKGAREAADAYGMQLDYAGPLRINPEEQIKLLEKALAAKADAVLLQGLNDPRYRAAIDKAADQGTVVLTIDTDEPESKRLAYIGTDNFAAGERLGELVAGAAFPPSEIAVLIGNEQAPNQQLRLNGFQSVIDKSRGLKVVEVRSSSISRLKAAAVAEELLDDHPGLDFAVGLSALDGAGIAEAAERFPSRGLQIFAFDDLEETVDLIRSGGISATLVQQPYEMGYVAVSMLNDHIQGKPVTERHYTAASVLDRSSIAEKPEGAGRP